MTAERPAAKQGRAVPAEGAVGGAAAGAADRRAAPPGAELDEPEARPNRLLELVGQFWAWLFLLVLVVFFSVTGKGFFDLFNFQAMGANVAIMLIMALGQTFVIISGGIDLSTGFVMGLAAIGGSAEAALRAGIPVRRHTIRIYVLSALLAAVAGVLYATRFTNGAANAGDPLLLDSIAAVVIGGASLFGGAGTIAGTVIGALIIAVIQNGLVILAINPFWQFVT